MVSTDLECRTWTAHRAGWLVLLAGAAAMLGGCSEKSYLDPSINGSGRWAPTPVSMPILTRLAAIEDESGDMVEYSDPLPGDLLPEPRQYRFGPADSLKVTAWDLVVKNQPEVYEVEVDPQGMIDVPQLGRLYVNGLTAEEIAEVVKKSMLRFVSNPLASVVAVNQRQQTYTLFGGVDRPGPYFVQRANFRLLEALTVGGKFDESAEEIFVIRQVPLTDEASGTPAGPAVKPPAQDTAPKDTRPILDIIDEIAPPKADKPQPGLFAARQPDSKPKPPPRAPTINLPDEQEPARPQAAAPAPAGTTRWVFVNGKWTQVVTRPAGANAEGGGPPAPTQAMVTQRVIRIPLKELLAGKQSVNIVIRPGDVIRLPTSSGGVVYIGGQVNRPGVYGLPGTSGLTLTAAIQGAAGGYGNIAIPSRIELTRRTGKDRESTILLDGAAIANREQPDLYLKPNDVVVVGTNFWALPLAIIRNGFRSSYGFGFVMDRNLSNDIFGPEPQRFIQ